MSKKILILGGGGFIGGHLGNRLISEGCFVRIVDIRHHQYYIKPDICDDFILADLRDPDVVVKLLNKDYDEVYQLASDVGGAGYIFDSRNDSEILRNSSLINLNISERASKGGIGKLFFSSSSCVYPFVDSNYGLEKLFSERLYRSYPKINIRIGRLQNVFGTHDTISGNKERFITAVCRKVSKAKDGNFIEIWGTGEQKRSFIYVDDCITEIIKLMKSEVRDPVNIGSEKQISINDITKLIISISHKNLSIYNIFGQEFRNKYGFDCPVGVMEKTVESQTRDISIKGLIDTYYWVAKN
jgi:GDP-D-mannose 3', 5'-epimerase